MSDVVWQAAIAALLAIYMEWSRRKAENAVEKVKTTLSTENIKQSKKLDSVVVEVQNTASLTTEVATKILTVEEKLDNNTLLTTEVKQQTNETIIEKLLKLDDHDSRIAALEVKITEVRTTLDIVGKNVDYTRHEIRGYMQTLTNKLDLMVMRQAKE